MRRPSIYPLALFTVACGSSDPEPPLTPASYTAPRTSRATPRAKGTATRPQHEAPKASAASPLVVTGIEGLDSRTAIAMARCERETRCGNVGEEKDCETEDDCVSR